MHSMGQLPELGAVKMVKKPESHGWTVVLVMNLLKLFTVEQKTAPCGSSFQTLMASGKNDLW